VNDLRTAVMQYRRRQQMLMRQPGVTDLQVVKAMPESALPFSIYLASYSEAYPSHLAATDDMTTLLKPSQLQLTMLIDALMHEDTARHSGEPALGTLAHLNHLLQVRSRHLVDCAVDSAFDAAAVSPTEVPVPPRYPYLLLQSL
jgi:hypothetical protein